MNQWRQNMLTLCGSFFLINLTHTIVMPFLPLLMKTDFGISDPAVITLWTGFIFAASYITMILFGPLWGALGDRFGNKSMLIKSGLWITVIMAFMAFAKTPWHLFLLRLANGALSGFVPAGNAMAAANTPKEKVGSALGTIMAGSMAGNVLGPVVGGFLISFLSFRAAFLFAAALRLLATLLVWFLVQEKEKKSVAVPSKAGSFAGVKTAFATKPLPTIFVLAAITQFALMGTNAFLSIYVEKFAQSADQIAYYITLATAVTGIASVLASPLSGRLTDKLGPGRMIGFCLCLAGCALLLQSLAQNFGQLLLLRLCFGFAVGGVSPSFNSFISFYAPEGMKARFFAYNNSFFQAGMMLGPILGGFFSNAFGMENFFFFCGVLLLCGFVWVEKSIVKKRKKAVFGA